MPIYNELDERFLIRYPRPPKEVEKDDEGQADLRRGDAGEPGGLGAAADPDPQLLEVRRS